MVEPVMSGRYALACRPHACGDYPLRDRPHRAAKSDCELDSRRDLGKSGASRGACRLTRGFRNRLRRHVFANTQTAAKENNVAFAIDGFVGDKHL